MLSPFLRRTPLVVAVATLSIGCSDEPSEPALQKRFTLVPESATVTVAPGSSKTTFVKVSRESGFSERITFGVSNIQDPLTVSMAVSVVPDSVRLDVSAPATAKGNYTFEVSGVSPNATSERLTMQVTVAP